MNTWLQFHTWYDFKVSKCDPDSVGTKHAYIPYAVCFNITRYTELVVCRIYTCKMFCPFITLAPAQSVHSLDKNCGNIRPGNR